MQQSLLTEKFIIKAKNKHGEKFDYFDVIYIDSDTKVSIKCEKHGTFLQTPNSHLREGSKGGCKRCATEEHPLMKKNEFARSNTDEFIIKATNVHGNLYNYSKVNYIDRDSKVIIICNEHGKFEQNARSHLKGYGCSACTGKKRNTNEIFIERANKIHNNKYDYSKVNYVALNTKVIIICQVHREFEQTPKSHWNGSGCIKCLFVNDTESFIAKSKIIHKDRYDYSMVNYITTQTEVTIICKVHREFIKTAYQHITNMQGCPKCNQYCPGCGLFRTYKKLCSYCKPKHQNANYKKTKEYEVIKFLREKFPDQEFIHNKSVGSDCTGSHLFPDILFDCAFYNLIVEIDEHKHRGANYKCDEQRMYDIVAKCGQPCIFIRYNPDSKQSDKNVLLNYVQKYLNITESNPPYPWNDLALGVEYLFY